ncbi:MAG TPA: hypothetical protein VKU94_01900 [Geobacterales bacterium]|nr:hypothetical protein [Geobacterales bacterium]
MAFSLRIFESKRPLTIHKFGPREKKLVYYNQGAMIVSYIWIILGLLFFVSNIINIDMFIHSVSLGFIGNTIFAFAPIFVSNLFSKTDPLKSMRFEALVIYNIGVLLRVIGSYYAFPIWSLLSGLLILIAIFILVFRILS